MPTLNPDTPLTHPHRSILPGGWLLEARRRRTYDDAGYKIANRRCR